MASAVVFLSRLGCDCPHCHRHHVLIQGRGKCEESATSGSTFLTSLFHCPKWCLSWGQPLEVSGLCGRMTKGHGGVDGSEGTSQRTWQLGIQLISVWHKSPNISCSLGLTSNTPSAPLLWSFQCPLECSVLNSFWWWPPFCSRNFYVTLSIKVYEINIKS